MKITVPNISKWAMNYHWHNRATLVNTQFQHAFLLSRHWHQRHAPTSLVLLNSTKACAKLDKVRTDGIPAWRRCGVLPKPRRLS
ncbi:hypothetical protein DL98DRAFT_146637 [Cadophora sp. DSE1049]|nr:hypothetical protein DL98DRAFT_146637 [Cadophora sp. DSE1049]